ncbi:MAG: hypothetical protein RI560_00775 [Natronomonas sp.]|uniref:hypothetical protein n=1 Tax=Natronomonas sp. TaxID=2184060 RepID=UPI0028704B26|nr:hypothetical protein [Natronomonas sp.]MDR9380194.1 hypothetical protein [Natronomonas sp.]MDR9430371.1 hypothetical protein [Natronomonas sp.]
MTALQSLGTLACLGGIVAVFAVATRRDNVPAMVNATISLLLVFVPILVDLTATRAYGVSLGLAPELPLWVAVAGLIHSYGMLGMYDDVWWWDHLTHTLSAALIAALLYAAILATIDTTAISVGRDVVWTVVVSATLLAGVFWELVELLARDLARQFRVPSVLDHYGRRDTVIDLGFDVVGALLVLVVDVRVFVPMATASPTGTVTALAWVLGLLTVGSLVLSLVVVVEHAE